MRWISVPLTLRGRDLWKRPNCAPVCLSHDLWTSIAYQDPWFLQLSALMCIFYQPFGYSTSAIFTKDPYRIGTAGSRFWRMSPSLTNCPHQTTWNESFVRSSQTTLVFREQVILLVSIPKRDRAGGWTLRPILSYDRSEQRCRRADLNEYMRTFGHSTTFATTHLLPFSVIHVHGRTLLLLKDLIPDWCSYHSCDTHIDDDVTWALFWMAWCQLHWSLQWKLPIPDLHYITKFGLSSTASLFFQPYQRWCSPWHAWTIPLDDRT